MTIEKKQTVSSMEVEIFRSLTTQSRLSHFVDLCITPDGYSATNPPPSPVYCFLKNSRNLLNLYNEKNEKIVKHVH